MNHHATLLVYSFTVVFVSVLVRKVDHACHGKWAGLESLAAAIHGLDDKRRQLALFLGSCWFQHTHDNAQMELDGVKELLLALQRCHIVAQVIRRMRIVQTNVTTSPSLWS